MNKDYAVDDIIQQIIDHDEIDALIANVDGIVDDIVENGHRQQRVFPVRATFEVPALFRERFRMWPAQAEALLTIVGPRLTPQTNCSCSLTAKQKLLAALRFYASNGFYYSVGDSQGMTLDCDI